MINVAALGEILRRFRFHGVPGSPVAVGVPGDRATELGAEVAALFSGLQTAQDDAAALLTQAGEEAARIRAADTELARHVLEGSQARARTAREVVATRIRAESSSQCAANLASAQHEAERIEQLAVERTPALVAEVVRRVLTIGAAR